jgi:hypothetical protein
MTNINEMEKQVDFLTEKISELELEGTTADVLRDFMRMTIDELKDLHEENCKLRKVLAELQIGEMQKFHDKIYENNLDNRKELNTDDKDNQKD